MSASSNKKQSDSSVHPYALFELSWTSSFFPDQILQIVLHLRHGRVAWSLKQLPSPGERLNLCNSSVAFPRHTPEQVHKLIAILRISGVCWEGSWPWFTRFVSSEWFGRYLYNTNVEACAPRWTQYPFCNYFASWPVQRQLLKWVSSQVTTILSHYTIFLTTCFDLKIIVLEYWHSDEQLSKSPARTLHHMTSYVYWGLSVYCMPLLTAYGELQTASAVQQAVYLSKKWVRGDRDLYLLCLYVRILHQQPGQRSEEDTNRNSQSSQFSRAFWNLFSLTCRIHKSWDRTGIARWRKIVWSGYFRRIRKHWYAPPIGPHCACQWMYDLVWFFVLNVCYCMQNGPSRHNKVLQELV